MTLEELKECLNKIPPEFNKTEVRFCKKSDFGYYTYNVDMISYGETSKEQFVMIEHYYQ
jgi:hypothetical protein